MADSTPRVAVAMSGGVDSSVCAAVLKSQGRDVIGITMQLMPPDQAGVVESCCGFDSAVQAQQVAQQLSIAHHVFQCHDEFAHEVLEFSWREYARGLTPNPCVICNSQIKFGRMLEYARSLGAEYLASGHYAQIIRDEQRRPCLHRGRDRTKDQSYFLYALNADQLAHILLPLGQLSKPEVRQLARDQGLIAAESPDSQDACFLTASGSFPESLREKFRVPARPGPMVDEGGQVLGQHQGIHRYTIGQRRGLGLSLGKPGWIRAIDPENNSIEVTTRPEALLSSWLLTDGLHWGPQPRPEPQGLDCQTQIRSRHKPVAARIFPQPGQGVRVELAQPQKAVTPGQSAVFYDGDRVLGGGRIISAG